MEILGLTIVFLISALVIVPVFQKLNLGSVLGYLIAGMLIGPSGLAFIADTKSIFQFSEFGVIFLMFVIGLELQPSRLWVLRRSVFGLGTAQMVGTTAVVSVLAWGAGLSWQTALILGLGLSLSSTALVLQSLSEKNQLTAQHGRDAFAVLLFQDLAVIPVLALLPLLGSGSFGTNLTWTKVALPLGAILGLAFGGRMILRPAFKWIAGVQSREIFTAASLLVVVGSAGLMHSVGLSMGLGAFLAGVLLSDSEFRHELEANIEPFKALLLGLFFISVGMSAQIDLLWKDPVRVLGLVIALFAVKTAVIFAVKFFLKTHCSSALKLSVYLSQGGEFAFVIFSSAVAFGILDSETAHLFVVVVTLSMLLAPVLFDIDGRYAKGVLPKESREFDRDLDATPVVIAGFGRFGQIVGRLLALQKIPFTALDKSSEHVDFVRRFGNKTFYGDVTRLDVLASAKVASAKVFVLAIDNVEDSLKTAELVRRHFPQVAVYARARNRFHSYKLLDLGVNVFYRETFFSSLEMGRSVLVHMGIDDQQAARIVQKFRLFDEQLLIRQHAVYQNETQLIETSKQALADLEGLFESDAKESKKSLS